MVGQLDDLVMEARLDRAEGQSHIENGDYLVGRAPCAMEVAEPVRGRSLSRAFSETLRYAETRKVGAARLTLMCALGAQRVESDAGGCTTQLISQMSMTPGKPIDYTRAVSNQAGAAPHRRPRLRRGAPEITL